MTDFFARKLLNDFFNRVGLYTQEENDVARVFNVAESLSLDKEVDMTMNIMMGKIFNIEHGYKIGFEQATSARTAVYQAILKRYFLNRFTRVWTFYPEDGQDHLFSIPTWFCDLIHGMNWRFSSIILKMKDEAAKAFITDMDDEELKIIDTQILLRLYVFACEHEVVGFTVFADKD